MFSQDSTALLRKLAADSAQTASARSLPERKQLVNILTSFNSTLATSLSREQNISALAAPGTIAVLTGQQVGLFLGPVFTLYKALSTIAIARNIEIATGIRTVPVFWLQTEDHDFAEIRSAVIPTREGKKLALSLRQPARNFQVSVRYQNLGEDISNLTLVLQEQLGHFPGAPDILELFASAYRPGTSIADAFVRTLAELTKDLGLVFFDPRFPGVSQLTKPIYHRALDDRQTISQMLIERGNTLRLAGQTEQVKIRPTSPLFFLSRGNAAATERARLEETEKGFHFPGTDRFYSAAELHQLIEQEPGRFSSSALLRPLIQDSLFPTAVYVGGQAEMAYFSQIEPLYSLFDLSFPLPLLRARFTVLDNRSTSWTKQYGLSIEQLKQKEAGLLRTIVGGQGNSQSPLELEQQVLQKINEALQPYAESFARIDKTLLQPLKRCEEKIHSAVATVSEKYVKALAAQDEVLLSRLKKLQTIVVPDGIAQERIYSTVYFLCRYGREFLTAILAAIEPFETKEKIVEL